MMDRYQYYRSILLVMLATDSIDPSVKNFSFLTDSINHRFENKIFFCIFSNLHLVNPDNPFNGGGTEGFYLISTMYVSIFTLVK